MNLAELQSTTYVKWLNTLDREGAACELFHSLQCGDGGVAWEIMKELGLELTAKNVYKAVDLLREQHEQAG